MRILSFIVAFALGGTPAAAGEALWAEGERWTEQRGSVGADRPPFGAGGGCLGSHWGGRKGHYVVYRFRLAEPMADARLHLRYARKHEGDALFAVKLDGRVVDPKAAFPATGGWGHLRDSEWAYRAFRLGGLAAGRRELRLTSLADRNNTNLDGFFLASGAFNPPNARKVIERAPRLATLGPPGSRPVRVDPALSIEDFHPMASDPYCPVEWLSEFRSLDWPRVTGADARAGRMTFDAAAKQWNHLATLATDGKPTAVFERDVAAWGLFAFIREGRDADHMLKPIGDLRKIVADPPEYPPNFEGTLLRSHSDLLGEKVLAAEDGPSFEACAGFLPDVAGYTFLSTEASPDIIVVQPDGRLGTIGDAWGQKQLAEVWFDPREHVPECEPTDARRGLLGCCLPAIDYGFYDHDSRAGWEEIAFAVSDDEHPTKLALYVYLRIAKPEGAVERCYYRSRAGANEAIGADEFFTRLLAFREQWDGAFRDAMHILAPEPRLVYASTASLARAIITYDGDKPRYGVGHYGKPQHGTFPPTTLSMVNACIEWNLMGRARRYLDWYLDKAVKPDGTFDYYGPAVSEYGQMLDAVARFARRSADADWLRRRMPKIEAVAGHLMGLRREGLAKHPEGDARHGLLFGAPEADTRKEVDFHYSGNAWAWRGWTEIGRALIALGDEPMQRRGKELLAEAEALRKDIDASIAKSIIQTTKPPFIPPVAGFDKPFERMTQDRFASYTNYRYWIEMLSAGGLRPAWADAIIDYRRTHGGEMLGTTRFSGHLDDWPYAGYAWGLLLRDRVEHFLLGLYGDLALHRMHGTFTAYEQTAIRGLAHRPYVADYCVPAQLVVPLMVRWMLVFEEPDAEVLWLCKATPRRWLSPGRHSGMAVSRATTRWGLVGFSVQPTDDAVEATIELPRHGFPAELRLRLRLPDGRRIGRVTVNGRPHDDVDPAAELIRIRRPQAPTLAIRVITTN